MHRRKSSKEEHVVDKDGGHTGTRVQFPGVPLSDSLDGTGSDSPRARVNSVPSPSYMLNERDRGSPTSAGPYRTSFGAVNQPNGYEYPESLFRSNFSHSRTLSYSGMPSSSKSSPLNVKFIPRPRPDGEENAPPPPPRPSSTFQQRSQLNGGPPSPTNTRRHSRIHSRNLSVFFPRPGSLPAPIAEDEAQEEAPVTIIPSASTIAVPTMQKPPGRKKFGEGFSFGGRATSPSSTSSSEGVPSTASPPTRTMRRGHHHKHSLSHNFFSFLEPGAAAQFPPSQYSAQLDVTPSTTPVSVTQNAFEPIYNPDKMERTAFLNGALAMTVVQFLLGSSLWVSGQQNGSLGCTGLGYWVVFDSFGIALNHLLPSYLASSSLQVKSRRTYGNARIETLSLFAQTVYLLFASVYVCKETVEHVLLSLGNGHHHHRMDEDAEGIQAPLFLLVITVVSLISTNIFYDNHSNLIKSSGHKLPSFLSLFRPSNFRASNLYSKSKSPSALLLSNPFTIVPLLFAISLFVAFAILPPTQHQPFDLLVAAAQTVFTFSVAYPAAVVQGAVLLQTSPARGMPGGRMEAFLRTMREIERHPLVLHLPAPHMWQITPASISALSNDTLVVTIELHVRRDLDDNEVLSLTRWAHDRVTLALGARNKNREDETEVTVGIVRG